MNVLVIDVGTSSMRGILFDHQGKCLTEKQAANADAELVANITKQVMAQLGLK